VQTFLPSFTVFRFLARLAFCLSSQTVKKKEPKKLRKYFFFFPPFYFGVWSEKKNGGKKNGGKTKWRQKNGGKKWRLTRSSQRPILIGGSAKKNRFLINDTATLPFCSKEY